MPPNTPQESWDPLVLAPVTPQQSVIVPRQQALGESVPHILSLPPEAPQIGAHRFGVFPVTPQIAVGAAPSVFQISDLRQLGVTHLYNLRGHASPLAPFFRAFFREVLHTRLKSTGSLSEMLFTVLFELHRMVHSAPDARVLVHCREGISRSVTAVCAYLVMLGIPPEEAQQLLRRSRPGARPYIRDLWENERLMTRSAELGETCVQQVRADILDTVGPRSWEKS